MAFNSTLVAVSFQGTRGKEQFFLEILETLTIPKKKLRSCGSVERYFYVALQSI